MDEPALDCADRENVPCYLETPVPENIAFYERLGFCVERKLRLLPEDGGSPAHWAMRRLPQ